MVFYEIMTAGAIPYVKMKNAVVKAKVPEGTRKIQTKCTACAHEIIANVQLGESERMSHHHTTRLTSSVPRT